MAKMVIRVCTAPLARAGRQLQRHWLQISRFFLDFGQDRQGLPGVRGPLEKVSGSLPSLCMVPVAVQLLLSLTHAFPEFDFPMLVSSGEMGMTIRLQAQLQQLDNRARMLQYRPSNSPFYMRIFVVLDLSQRLNLLRLNV